MDEPASRTAVAEHASQLGSWRMEFLAPTARLAPFVRRFNAYAERDTGSLMLPFNDPFLLMYKDDPRFKAYCEKAGLLAN